MDFQENNQPGTQTEQNPTEAQPSNGYNNNNPNGYPYYDRNAYQLPYEEPGGSLAHAAMVLGIISIVSCFVFPTYPPFIFGSIAIILALLSKGRRPKLLAKARTGIFCAAAGLAVNTVMITSFIYLVFTNPDLKANFNRLFEDVYGVTFDEVMDEIMEENGFSY